MTFTHGEAETACCLWEAMLEMRSKIPALDAAFEKNGVGVMRNVAVDLSKPVEAIWLGMTDEQRDNAGSFDWEMCPDIIRKIDWTQWPPALSPQLGKSL